ncbi:S-layer homology domain-containing protein [Candidatus Peregrinibacteria bacterium]|nr:S-layer homology domain-containing protein [Candidatus Peregrinibacteria bacterium]MBT3598958.1 S-layer homology domain-containing protein [Candidatus Peregrinibacteria bacterium]MBT4585904.1 S-layer homology domain-containing protein [Candidatus Peregrinibacteria bacterium]MBT6731118.1 S-layer homology domain-containing protein [Candidatus Peregrinibacteria bacterium]MBT7009782.1 S-layer homology domain-containing protein [Candidatus Peregrinibacteria bacterium]
MFNQLIAQRRNRIALMGSITITLFCVLLAMSSTQYLYLRAGLLSDVSKVSYEGQSITYLQERGIVTGFPDGTFKGNNPVNRVEAAKMLLLAADYTLRHVQNSGQFPDIQSSAWYEQYALNAVEHGLMDGYPNGTFGPDKPVLRSEFLKMLSNAFTLPFNNPHHYTDVPNDAWFSGYAGNAEQYNTFLYDKSQLLPSAPMSREEVSWAIYQMLINYKYNLVIRTPFDYESPLPVKTPGHTNTIPTHAAASDSSSSESSANAPIIITPASSAPYTPTPSLPPITTETCTDSDVSKTFPEGINEYSKGSTVNLLMSRNNVYEDSCVEGTNTLYEYYCNNNGFVERKRINCQVTCRDGVCSTEEESSSSSISSSSRKSFSSISSSEPISTTCTTTDSTFRFINGRNAFAKGTANGPTREGIRVSYTDSCKDSNTVKEYFCDNEDFVVSDEISCTFGCEDNACVSIGGTGRCSDTDVSSKNPDGIDFYTVGTLEVLHPEEGFFKEDDYCASSTLLNEFYCFDGGRVGRYTVKCDCTDGHCAEGSIEDDDDDGGSVSSKSSSSTSFILIY